MTIPSILDLLKLMEENQAQAALIRKLGEAVDLASKFHCTTTSQEARIDEALAAYEEWRKENVKRV